MISGKDKRVHLLAAAGLGGQTETSLSGILKSSSLRNQTRAIDN